MGNLPLILFTSLVVGLVVLNIYASFIVWRSPLFELERKIFQIFFIWLVPALGAILAIRLINERKDVQKSPLDIQKIQSLKMIA